MTSLKESIYTQLAPIKILNDEDRKSIAEACRIWAEGYIEELEEDMQKTIPYWKIVYDHHEYGASDMVSASESGYKCAVQRMLKFLRGEST